MVDQGAEIEEEKESSNLESKGKNKEDRDKESEDEESEDEKSEYKESEDEDEKSEGKETKSKESKGKEIASEESAGEESEDQESESEESVNEESEIEESENEDADNLASLKGRPSNARKASIASVIADIRALATAATEDTGLSAKVILERSLLNKSKRGGNYHNHYMMMHRSKNAGETWDQAAAESAYLEFQKKKHWQKRLEKWMALNEIEIGTITMTKRKKVFKDFRIDICKQVSHISHYNNRLC